MPYKERYWKNPSNNRLLNTIWKEKNPDKTRESNRKSYWKHRDSRLLKTREYYKKNSARICKRTSEYTKKHPEMQNRRYHKFMKVWKLSVAKVFWKQAENIAANFILPKEGFTDIWLISNDRRSFPFDIFAKKDNKTCAIDVTVSCSKHIKNFSYKFTKYLDFDYYLLIVRPDFSIYKLEKIIKERHSYNFQNIKNFKEVPIANR